jgi:hypothetical protein
MKRWGSCILTHFPSSGQKEKANPMKLSAYRGQPFSRKKSGIRKMDFSPRNLGYAETNIPFNPPGLQPNYAGRPSGRQKIPGKSFPARSIAFLFLSGYT